MGQFWLAACFAMLVPWSLRAHPSPDSAVALDFHRDGVAAELTIPLVELELAFQQPLAANPAQACEKFGPALKDYIRSHVNPTSEDGRPWTVQVNTFQLQTNKFPNDLIAQVWMQPPAGAPVRKFVFIYSVVIHAVKIHWAMVLVRNDWDTAVFSSKPEPLGTIRYPAAPLTIDRTNGSWWQGFHSVFLLGVRHIADGTDHLLFLLVLLLPAPLVETRGRWGDFGGLKRSLVQLLKIVSAFTLGHSLTLLVGAVGLVSLPARLVEVLIAISIFVSAIHAIRPWFAGREVFIAAGFGLIHGLAFASSLAEFNFSAWSTASTVLGFNLGIEAMQLVVVAATIPWLILLSRTRFYSPVRILGATFGGLASLGWIGERAFHWPNPLNAVVEAMARHSPWVAGALAVCALGATAWQSTKKGVGSQGDKHRLTTGISGQL